MVALVGKSGEVFLVFRIARIEEGQSITAADGHHYPDGCVLIARRGSMRVPGRRDPSVLNVNRHALGAFAYFEASSFERVIYEPSTGVADDGEQSPRSRRPFPFRRYPLFANNIDKTLNQPERELIRAYTAWVGDTTMFAHHALKESGLYTDLFIPRRWTLVEAKATTSRKALREAVGQLFDYQRHYDRSPSLAVLLPEHPGRDVMGLFEKKRITVIWRSRGNSFRDSADGALTSGLCRLVRDRL
ncbi:MAG: hypothetical protein KA745_10055 [Gemmatimonadales bacterium]|nr:hypothetical protein [Gemmatimonadales bacterium]